MSQKTVSQMMQELQNMSKDRLYVQLNNLFLSIERGDVKLTIRNAHFLLALAGSIWNDPAEDFIRDDWMNEFQKLPGWLNV